jgi:eukaryotic-like serine/threonine-protein kinase
VFRGRTSGDPRVKVLDFGLATTGIGEHAADPEQASMTDQRTEPGRILGTPADMSPEQARGQVVDKRTDIWAFGCILFEMLTGKGPFGGSTITDTLARILEREPEWAWLTPETPSSIRILLRRCLTKDPDQRLHDIADARIEIDERDLVTTSTPERGGRPSRLLRWTVAALMILAPTSAATFLWLRVPAAPIAARVAFNIEPPQTASFAFRSGPIAMAPDGGQLAAIVSSEDRSQLWVRPVDALEWRIIRGTKDASFPFWKPDSREVGFFAGGKLKAVPLREGGLPYVICDAPEGYALQGGATWNRDNVIVFMSRAFTLQKVLAKGGAAPVAVTTLGHGEISHRWPSFLPDGQHFLYLALGPPRAPRDLRVGSLDGTAPTSLGPQCLSTHVARHRSRFS